MLFIDTPDGVQEINILSVEPDGGYNWIGKNGITQGTGCKMPIRDENGKPVKPTTTSTLDQRIKELETRLASVEGKVRNV